MNAPFIERRKDHIQRNLIILGNCLSLWAGIPPTTPEEHQRLAKLLTAWDDTLESLRREILDDPL